MAKNEELILEIERELQDLYDTQARLEGELDKVLLDMDSYDDEEANLQIDDIRSEIEELNHRIAELESDLDRLYEIEDDGVIDFEEEED